MLGIHQADVDVLRWYNGTIPLVDMQTAGISLIPQLDKSAVVIGRFANPEDDRSHHGARLSVGELQVSFQTLQLNHAPLCVSPSACGLPALSTVLLNTPPPPPPPPALLQQVQHISPTNEFNKYFGYPFDPVESPGLLDASLNPVANPLDVMELSTQVGGIALPGPASLQGNASSSYTRSLLLISWLNGAASVC